MRRLGEEWGYVVEDRRYRGVTSREKLVTEVASPERRSLYDVAEAGPTLTAGDVLETALPTALETDYPVPVVDDDGNLMGVVSSREMSSVLSPPKVAAAPASPGPAERDGGGVIAPPGPGTGTGTVDPPQPAEPRHETVS